MSSMMMMFAAMNIIYSTKKEERMYIERRNKKNAPTNESLYPKIV